MISQTSFSIRLKKENKENEPMKKIKTENQKRKKKKVSIGPLVLQKI